MTSYNYSSKALKNAREIKRQAQMTPGQWIETGRRSGGWTASLFQHVGLETRANGVWLLVRSKSQPTLLLDNEPTPEPIAATSLEVIALCKSTLAAAGARIVVLNADTWVIDWSQK